MQQRATNVGIRLYRLIKKLERQEARFQKLIENAPPYMGQTELWVIDVLVNYYKRTQKAKADVEKTTVALREQEMDVLALMDYLEFPPVYMLTAMILGEARIGIWYDEDRNVHCDWDEIEPEPDPPNVMIFKFPPCDEPVTKSTKKKSNVVDEKDEDDKVDDDTLIAIIKKLYDEDGQPVKRRWEELDLVPEFVEYPNGRPEEVYGYLGPKNGFMTYERPEDVSHQIGRTDEEIRQQKERWIDEMLED